MIYFSPISFRLTCLVLLTIDRPAFLVEGRFESIAAFISCFLFVFIGLIGAVLVLHDFVFYSYQSLIFGEKQLLAGP